MRGGIVTCFSMNISRKLGVIQKALGFTQTQLAQRLGVSFVTLHSWLNGKSQPRFKKQVNIDALFLEVTGQKRISSDELTAKKQVIAKKAEVYKDVARYIEEHPDIRDQFVLKLTYHSNSIEGSTLTEPDTAAILFDNVSLPNHSLTEQLEAKNHQTALLHLLRHVAENGRIDENFILKLHGMLMNGIRPDAGAYRNHGVRIVGVHLATANYASIPRLLAEALVEANKKTRDIVALSANVHSRFEQIHPFSDGNGRIGRLLMTAMLLRVNAAPAIILRERKRIYYNALYKAQTTEDTSQLEDFLCDAVLGGFGVLERND